MNDQAKPMTDAEPTPAAPQTPPVSEAFLQRFADEHPDLLHQMTLATVERGVVINTRRGALERFFDADPLTDALTSLQAAKEADIDGFSTFAVDPDFGQPLPAVL